jgi:hypothetical protein
VLVWNVGNFRREHFMAEVARTGCGDNPGINQMLFMTCSKTSLDNMAINDLVLFESCVLICTVIGSCMF